MIAANRSARTPRRGRLITTAAAAAALGLGLTACQTGQLTVPDADAVSPPSHAVVSAPHGIDTRMPADRIEAILDRRDAERADRYADMWAAYEARLRDARPPRERTGTADTLERMAQAEKAPTDTTSGDDTVDRPLEAEDHMRVR